MVQYSPLCKMAAFPFISFYAALFAISMGIFLRFNSKQPKPYMDEIFHVPQAKKYCEFKFSEWDPKITTLPGLYLVSFVALRLLAFFSGEELQLLCSTALLRMTNVFFFMGNVWLFRKLLFVLGRDNSSGKGQQPTQEKESSNTECSITALVLAMFPVLYFFTFLYYTDTSSVFFVLLMYYCGVCGNHFLSALSATAAVIVRQTNVVWVVFTAGVSVLKTLQLHKKLAEKPLSFTEEVKEFILSLCTNILFTLKCLWSYLIVVAGFVVFVISNGGIVVGDKSQHKATLNFPQLFYLIAFTLLFSSSHVVFPEDILYFLKTLKYAVKKPATVIGLLFVSAVMVLIVYKFTYVHEYLLADNRHYPFYLWRKVYARHWSVKYALVLFYMFAAWVIHCQLSLKQQRLWIAMFYICTALVTIPQKLLEFRYFVIPYILYRLHIPLQPYKRLVVECCLYIFVNAATFYLYLERPFRWSHSPEDVQRFMW